MGELLRGKQIAEIPLFDVQFTFASGTPIDFGALVAGDIVVGADIVIETAFDDPAAILTLGLVSSPGNILASNMNDPTGVGTYNNSAAFPVAGPDALRLQVLPGTSTQGSGRAIVTVRRKAS